MEDKMTYLEFKKLLTDSNRPVILVEGIRNLPESDLEKLIQFGRCLAEDFPHAVFRTGNARGSDEAFAQGIKAVDPKRLEYVLPYKGYRKKMISQESCQTALNEMPETVKERAVHQTLESSPEYRGLMEMRNTVPKLRSKSIYLLRDTIKVTGAEETGLSPATTGIFYVDRLDPMKGGTGHTVRVCRKQGIPAVFQEQWLNWCGKALCD